jgi:hypothetical protein
MSDFSENIRDLEDFSAICDTKRLMSIILHASKDLVDNSVSVGETIDNLTNRLNDHNLIEISMTIISLLGALLDDRTRDAIKISLAMASIKELGSIIKKEQEGKGTENDNT